MAGARGGGADERGGAPDEGAVAGVGDDDEGLAALNGRGGEALVALVLFDRERFTGESGLIDLEVGIFGDDAAIGRDDGTLKERSERCPWAKGCWCTYFLDLKDIAGDDLGSFDLAELTVAENHGLESEGLLELVDDGAGLEFLDETDTGVEEQQSADDTEIDPIGETGGKHGSSLWSWC